MKQTAIVTAAIVLGFLAPNCFAQTVKVFILAGQSNMEGHGGIKTLEQLGQHPTHGQLLQKIKKADGSFVVRDDVFVSYKKPDQHLKRPLSVGMGVWGEEWFGPELMFGIEMGDQGEVADPQKMEELINQAINQAMETDAAYQQAKQAHDTHVCNWECHYQGSGQIYCLVGYSLAEAMKPLVEVRPTTTPRVERETRDISGWQVHVAKKLLEMEAEDTAKALGGLQKMLDEIVRNVPAAAVAEMKKVPLYFSPSYQVGRSGAEFHPGAEWLLDNGRDPMMAQGVEFSGVHDFEAEMRRMPNFALHELAHAFHFRVLPDGFNNPEIKAAFRRAKQSGLYDRVERTFGNDRPNTFERAYAMTTAMEYFAETTEAYFSRNDFFPFTRAELLEHDPEMHALLEKLWGVGTDQWLKYPGGDGPGKGKQVVLIAAEQEYRSEQSMPMLAKVLSTHHGFDCTVLFGVNANGEVDPTLPVYPEKGKEAEFQEHHIPGLDQLASADLVIFCTRLLTLPKSDLEKVVAYVDSGKPLIALRTANHGFRGPLPYKIDGKQVRWGEDVLGGTFLNHHGNWQADSTRGILEQEQTQHPILIGVNDIWGDSDVYRTYEEGRRLPDDCTALVWGQPLLGRQPDDLPNEKLELLPVAWVKPWRTSHGVDARVFHCTMGSGIDFKNPGLRRVVVNAAYWCVELEGAITATRSVDVVGNYEPLDSGFHYEELGVKPRPVSDYK